MADSDLTLPTVGVRPLYFDDKGPQIEVGTRSKIQLFWKGSGTRNTIYFKDRDRNGIQTPFEGATFTSVTYDSFGNVDQIPNYQVTDTGTCSTVSFWPGKYDCYSVAIGGTRESIRERYINGCIEVKEGCAEASKNIYIYDDYLGFELNTPQILLSWVGNSPKMVLSFFDDNDKQVPLFTDGNGGRYDACEIRKGDVFIATVNDDPKITNGWYRIKFGTGSSAKTVAKISVNTKEHG